MKFNNDTSRVGCSGCQIVHQSLFVCEMIKHRWDVNGSHPQCPSCPAIGRSAILLPPSDHSQAQVESRAPSSSCKLLQALLSIRTCYHILPLVASMEAATRNTPPLCIMWLKRCCCMMTLHNIMFPVIRINFKLCSFPIMFPDRQHREPHRQAQSLVLRRNYQVALCFYIHLACGTTAEWPVQILNSQ